MSNRIMLLVGIFAALSFSVNSSAEIDSSHCYEDDGCVNSEVNDYVESSENSSLFVSGFLAEQINHTTSRAVDSSIDEDDDGSIYRLTAGSDLKTELTKWATQAGYRAMVWNVLDEEGKELLLPVRASAALRCEFEECLRQLKKAYSLARKPIYLDIDVKRGNKVVYVEQLHLGQ